MRDFRENKSCPAKSRKSTRHQVLFSVCSYTTKLLFASRSHWSIVGRSRVIGVETTMTATFQHPFQCIRHIERRLAGLQNLLLASSGPKIYSYAAGDGKRLSVWPQNADEKSKNSTEAPTAGPSTEPPEKKRKMSASGDDTAEDSKNASQASGDHQPPVAWSNIPLLVPTTNAKHLVAVTAEDKCVRVLGVGEDGILQQLSAR